MEMTNHEQQAAALFEIYCAEKGYVPSEIGVKDMIAFAAFCMENQGWKKYPEEKPEKDGLILTAMSKDFLAKYDSEFKQPFLLNAWGPYKMNPGASKNPKVGDVSSKFYWADGSVIAWMPIPEYKP